MRCWLRLPGGACDGASWAMGPESTAGCRPKPLPRALCAPAAAHRPSPRARLLAAGCECARADHQCRPCAHPPRGCRWRGWQRPSARWLRRRRSQSPAPPGGCRRALGGPTIGRASAAARHRRWRALQPGRASRASGAACRCGCSPAGARRCGQKRHHKIFGCFQGWELGARNAAVTQRLRHILTYAATLFIDSHADAAGCKPGRVGMHARCKWWCACSAAWAVPKSA